MDSAYACLVEHIGEENAKSFYVDHCLRLLRYNGNIFHGTYVYKVEYEDVHGNEYEIEVNGHSGYAAVTDIDLRYR